MASYGLYAYTRISLLLRYSKVYRLGNEVRSMGQMTSANQWKSAIRRQRIPVGVVGLSPRLPVYR
jgi:hypothetical protein